MVWTGESCSGKSASAEDFKEVIDACANSGPPCATCVRDVGELALQIAGGTSSPNLFLLDRLGKTYGENKSLGEEFVKTLVSISAPKTEKLCYLRRMS